MSQVLIGSHMRVPNNNLAEMVSDLVQNEGRVVQFFGKSPMSLKAKASVFTGYEKAKSLGEKHGVVICTHAQYVFNFTLPELGGKWKGKRTVESIMEDLELNDKIGGIGTVIHLGSNTKNLSDEKCISNMVDNVKIIVDEMAKRKIKSKFIIENQPQSGKKVFYNESGIMNLWRALKEKIGNDEVKKHIGLCTDTCHFFIAKYKPEEQVTILKTLHDHIGIDLIHFNDSKSKTADRHEDLFSGFIGDKCADIARFGYKNNIPMVIERVSNSYNLMTLQHKAIIRIVRYNGKTNDIIKSYKKNRERLL